MSLTLIHLSSYRLSAGNTAVYVHLSNSQSRPLTKNSNSTPSKKSFLIFLNKTRKSSASAKMTGKRYMTVEEREILLNLSEKDIQVETLQINSCVIIQRSPKPWSASENVKVCSTYLSRVENASQQKELTVDYFESTKLIRNRQLKSSKKPHLSSKNFQKRLEFCKKYEGWTVEDWKKVVLSDETNVQAEPNGGHKKVWWKPTEKLSE